MLHLRPFGDRGELQFFDISRAEDKRRVSISVTDGKSRGMGEKGRQPHAACVFHNMSIYFFVLSLIKKNGDDSFRNILVGVFFGKISDAPHANGRSTTLGLCGCLCAARHVQTLVPFWFATVCVLWCRGCPCPGASRRRCHLRAPRVIVLVSRGKKRYM